MKTNPAILSHSLLSLLFLSLMLLTGCTDQLLTDRDIEPTYFAPPSHGEPVGYAQGSEAGPSTPFNVELVLTMTDAGTVTYQQNNLITEDQQWAGTASGDLAGDALMTADSNQSLLTGEGTIDCTIMVSDASGQWTIRANGTMSDGGASYTVEFIGRGGSQSAYGDGTGSMDDDGVLTISLSGAQQTGSPQGR